MHISYILHSFQFYLFWFHRFELKQFEVEIDFAPWESTAASNVLRFSPANLLYYKVRTRQLIHHSINTCLCCVIFTLKLLLVCVLLCYWQRKTRLNGRLLLVIS